MFNMTINLKQLKTRVEGVLAALVLNIAKEQTDPIDGELTAYSGIVPHLPIDLEHTIQKAKK